MDVNEQYIGWYLFIVEDSYDITKANVLLFSFHEGYGLVSVNIGKLFIVASIIQPPLTIFLPIPDHQE